jgi:hypothetical protein
MAESADLFNKRHKSRRRTDPLRLRLAFVGTLDDEEVFAIVDRRFVVKFEFVLA